MMADPIQQLAATGIVVPAPVHVRARLDVRLHLRWPDPEVIVQFSRRLRDGDIPGGRAGEDFGQIIDFLRELRQLLQQGLASSGEVMVAAGQADLHAGHFADQTVANDLRGIVEVPLRTLPGTRLPNALVRLDGLHNGLLFGDGAGKRFLPVNVLLIPGRLGGDERVPMIRHGEHHRVDVRAGHHLAVIVIGFAVLVFVFLVNLVRGRFQVILVDVAGSDHLAVSLPHEILGVAGALHAPANHAHRDAFRRSRAAVCAESTGRNDCGRSDGGGGCSDELAARNPGK